LTIDITSDEFHNAILCIAPSPVDKTWFKRGTDDSNVQATKDGGKTERSFVECLRQMKRIPIEPDYSAGEVFVSQIITNDVSTYAVSLPHDRLRCNVTG
jgi:hypothetical protein